ncbi:MAG: hypothetical protein US97_C0001G0027 [Microgenomates group bacterium GW2011_GWF1_38_5]|nr:MAG: hypothetical protein US97_C0001G0027 [Microgenomates group bacterium GW2011_GWF1_38_5]
MQEKIGTLKIINPNRTTLEVYPQVNPINGNSYLAVDAIGVGVAVISGISVGVVVGSSVGIYSVGVGVLTGVMVSSSVGVGVKVGYGVCVGISVGIAVGSSAGFSVGDTSSSKSSIGEDESWGSGIFLNIKSL